ncbi:hypothetical protein SUGI_0277240 [Cryptomeria japonica]|nr:hypothetical protein SUGI_0277240 [Cryptomeria japonica]
MLALNCFLFYFTGITTRKNQSVFQNRNRMSPGRLSLAHVEAFQTTMQEKAYISKHKFADFSIRKKLLCSGRVYERSLPSARRFCLIKCFLKAYLIYKIFGSQSTSSIGSI